MLLTPSPMSHLLEPPSSVTYFMDGPYANNRSSHALCRIGYMYWYVCLLKHMKPYAICTYPESLGSRHSARGVNLLCLTVSHVNFHVGEGPKSIAKLDGGHGRIPPRFTTARSCLPLKHTKLYNNKTGLATFYV